MGKNTQCVHSGSVADRLSGGLNTPIFTSSSFRYLDTAENVYPRYFNTPNQNSVVEKLCALEAAEAGVLFSSGMAAVGTVFFALLQPGDHVVMQRDIYGGSYHFATSEFPKFGIQYSFVANRPEDFEAAVRENTRMIYIESPSNPLLMVTDIAAVARISRKRNLISVIDNTFATPINQRPLSLGVDVVIHSGTKYLGGHSDLCCGAVLCSRALTGRIRSSAVNFGGSLNAADCALLERSLKTLGLRVERQNQNALTLARFLADHPRVQRVYYPGLATHAGHETAAGQMQGYGGMLSFALDEAIVRPGDFVRRLQWITPAISLGGVESIICAPADTSHVKLTPREREELGITAGLFRLSVGIEDVEDLIADLDRALTG